MKKAVKIIVVIVILLGAIVLGSSCYTVAEDEYVLVVRFSKVVGVTENAGLHFKIPFIDTVKTYKKNIQLYDLQPSDVLTSDSKAMSVDSYVLWKISDPLTFYRTLGTTSEACSRLDAATYNALKNIIGTMPQDSIIQLSDSAGKNDLNKSVYEQVKALTGSYGIEVTDVQIKRFDLPSENETAVYERMIAERKKISQSFVAEGQAEAQKIKNDVDREVNITVSDAEAKAEEIIAEGEKEYMQMLAAAYDTKDKQDFYVFMKSLDALKASLQGDNKTVILGSDSDLAKILMGVTG